MVHAPPSLAGRVTSVRRRWRGPVVARDARMVGGPMRPPRRPADPDRGRSQNRRRSRRHLLVALAAAGGALVGGLVAACSAPAQPPARGVPTLMPTALPTAVPASAPRTTPTVAGKPTSAVTPDARATATGPATGPAAAGRTPTPRQARRELVIAQPADPATLDPHQASLAGDSTVPFAIFDTLADRGEDQSVLRPMLATEWQVDERRWVFKLRSNVRFHSGDPFTAADVKFTIERPDDPAARSGDATFETVERIETPDPLTVVVVTRQPDPLLPARLAALDGQIVSKAYVERVGSDGFRRRPVGTGPYRFVERQPGRQLVLERFDEYWGGPAGFERVVVMARPDGPARVAALLAGEADLAVGVPTGQVEVIARGGRARVDGALYAGLHVLAVNGRVPPLDNPLVRQALSLAIDRAAIIRTIHHGQGAVPNGLIAQGDFGYDATLPPLEYSPTRAKQRLEAAGYRREEIVFETTRGYLDGDREMAELILGMWRRVGINSTLVTIDGAAQADGERGGPTRGLRWSAPTSPLRDPDGMMVRLLGTGAAPASWHDERWVRLGREARATLDQGVRLQNYRRMNALALEHLPWIPILQPRLLIGIADGIEFRPYGSGYLNLRRDNLRLRG